jgi:hypothetical protein
MGTIIQFPADAASRRPGLGIDGSPRRASTKQDLTRREMATVLILPVVRIERQVEETSGGRGPEEGTATPRRRRRRR